MYYNYHHLINAYNQYFASCLAYKCLFLVLFHSHRLLPGIFLMPQIGCKLNCYRFLHVRVLHGLMASMAQPRRGQGQTSASYIHQLHVVFSCHELFIKPHRYTASLSCRCAFSITRTWRRRKLHKLHGRSPHWLPASLESRPTLAAAGEQSSLMDILRCTRHHGSDSCWRTPSRILQVRLVRYPWAACQKPVKRSEMGPKRKMCTILFAPLPTSLVWTLTSS